MDAPATASAASTGDGTSQTQSKNCADLKQSDETTASNKVEQPEHQLTTDKTEPPATVNEDQKKITKTKTEIKPNIVKNQDLTVTNDALLLVNTNEAHPQQNGHTEDQKLRIRNENKLQQIEENDKKELKSSPDQNQTLPLVQFAITSTAENATKKYTKRKTDVLPGTVEGNRTEAQAETATLRTGDGTENQRKNKTNTLPDNIEGNRTGTQTETATSGTEDATNQYEKKTNTVPDDIEGSQFETQAETANSASDSDEYKNESEEQDEFLDAISEPVPESDNTTDLTKGNEEQPAEGYVEIQTNHSESATDCGKKATKNAPTGNKSSVEVDVRNALEDLLELVYLSLNDASIEDPEKATTTMNKYKHFAEDECSFVVDTNDEAISTEHNDENKNSIFEDAKHATVSVEHNRDVKGSDKKKTDKLSLETNMEFVLPEEDSPTVFDVAMRDSLEDDENRIPASSKSDLEGVPGTSKKILGAESDDGVAELLTSTDMVDMGRQALSSPVRKSSLSNVDSRTITRPKRMQGLTDAEAAQIGPVPMESTVNGPQAVAVIPPVITATQRAENPVVGKLEQPNFKNLGEPVAKEVSKKGEVKPVSHRSRQKTVTVHSQLSLEIANAFKISKNELNDESFMEVQHRIQNLVALKEKEWAAKHEKLVEEMDSWEHKAVERGVVICEYDRVVKQLVEALKSASSRTGSQNALPKNSLGWPGPERTVSPDETVLIRKERDQLAEDVISWETSYDELYKRYEKLRQGSLEIRKNADDTKQAYEDLQNRYDDAIRKFDALKTEAENELNRANLEMERQEKLRETDTLGLRLKVKHLEAKNNALAASLEAKIRELSDMESLFEDIVHKADRNAAQTFE